jgi:hypothetical protein
LVQNKESLCSRILGAKYFPGGDLLQAVAKPGMSYSWRSILKGVQVLKKGIILESWKWWKYQNLEGPLDTKEVDPIAISAKGDEPTTNSR